MTSGAYYVKSLTCCDFNSHFLLHGISINIETLGSLAFIYLCHKLAVTIGCQIL